MVRGLEFDNFKVKEDRAHRNRGAYVVYPKVYRGVLGFQVAGLPRLQGRIYRYTIRAYKSEKYMHECEHNISNAEQRVGRSSRWKI